MATKSYKTTGCFRFVVFLLIFAPIAYLGAAYYNGQDGIGNIKKMINKVVGMFSSSTSSASAADKGNNNSTQEKPTLNNSAEIYDLKSAVERKDKEINTLINENLDLKLKLKECENKVAPK